MFRKTAATLLVLLPALAGAPAHAAPLGGLAPGGCVTVDGPPCAPGQALDATMAVAVSPDGLHAYAAAATGDAVAAFRRTAGGDLEQLGCVSESGSLGACADGAGLDGAGGVAVSADGRNVYVAARNSNSVAAFARDPVSGLLTQLPGLQGCVSDTGSGGACADGAGLRWATAVAVSPDGLNVYAASRTSDAVAILARDPLSGALTQLPAAAGCVAEGGAGGCTAGRGLDGATALAIPPSGHHVYAASRTGDAVTAFARDAGSGALSQLGGAGGCASRTGAGGCAVVAGLDGATALSLDPSGRHLHVAATSANALTVMTVLGGPLTTLGCFSETPNDAWRGTVGCYHASRLRGAEGVTVAPDGRSVYVASNNASGVTAFARANASGLLQSLPGRAGCVTEWGGSCSDGTALIGPRELAVAPDGRSVYAAGSQSDGVAALVRSTATGPPSCRASSAQVTAALPSSLTLDCTDPTGDQLIFSVASQPAHGTLVPLPWPPGAYEYVPDPGYTGADSFGFRASDGAETSGIATFRLTVAAPGSAGPPPSPAAPPPGPASRPPAPDRDRRPSSQRTTSLLSRAADGGFPDGPSRNGTASHDQRIARAMAYESDATNVVAGDSNGLTDVFVVRRQGPWGRDGTPWRAGATELASSGLGGQPANGRSYRPALDGDSHHVPRCVAFVSDASNLVRGDTNGQPDAFVRDLRTGRVARVSVDGRGRQADGPTTEVAIDGACERVAFVADAPRLALGSTARAAWRSARTSRPRRGRRQVYVRVLRSHGHDRGFTGLTFLASASASGRAANGDAHELALARDGKSVAFSSTATNLVRGDRTPTQDVYRRAFPRRFRHAGHGRGLQTLRFTTTLVSQTARGRAGNGASGHPSITDVGSHVAYETLASDLLAGDSNGVSDVARADLGPRRPRQAWVSKSRHVGRPGNGPSNRPVISGAAEFVLFDSEATNLKPSASVRDDRNGVRDVFLWNAPTGNVSLESRDADNGYLETPSQAPATSSRGNYVPFESANPLIDLPLAERLLPQVSLDPRLVPPLLDPAAIVPDRAELTMAQRVSATAGVPMQQVYLRYLGPK